MGQWGAFLVLLVFSTVAQAIDFPVRRDTQIAVFSSGKQDLAARLQSLAAARKSIHIQTFIFAGDETGQAVSALLKKKKSEGVEVVVIVDGPSLFISGDRPSLALTLPTLKMYRDLLENGIDLRVHWVRSDSLNPDSVDRLVERLHEKLWIIDGAEPSAFAIIGGMNIANEYYQLGRTAPFRWRDQDIAIRGAMVQDLEAAFQRNLAFVSGGEVGELETENKSQVLYSVSREISDEITRLAEKPVTLDFEPAPGNYLHNEPRQGETLIHEAYLREIREAQSEILISNAYFIPTRALRRALVEAVQRGVRVIVLTNSAQTNDTQTVALASRSFYQELLTANFDPLSRASGGKVSVMEWRGDLYGYGTLHCKFAVFDRRVSIAGSSNLDPMSFTHNNEGVAVYESSVLSEQLAQLVEKDLDYAEEVTYQKALQYHAPAKLWEKLQLSFVLWARDWL